jgi:hypothetical protein
VKGQVFKDRIAAKHVPHAPITVVFYVIEGELLLAAALGVFVSGPVEGVSGLFKGGCVEKVWHEGQAEGPEVLKSLLEVPRR